MDELDVPPMLMDYRWVYDHPEEPREPSPADLALRPMRKLLKSSPKNFLAQMQTLERAFLLASAKEKEAAALKRAQEPEKPVGGPELDLGTERVEELIQRILGECSA